jgi:hypothetical protein
MDEKLPDNIVPITALRIKYDKVQKCTCNNRSFEVDITNKEVLCAGCGAVVNPFDAIKEIAFHHEQMNREVEALLNQRKQILSWKPHLLAVRELERIYRGGTMLPCCPHCGRGVEANELLRAQTNKAGEMERRKFENRRKESKV